MRAELLAAAMYDTSVARFMGYRVLAGARLRRPLGVGRSRARQFAPLVLSWQAPPCAAGRLGAAADRRAAPGARTAASGSSASCPS